MGDEVAGAWGGGAEERGGEGAFEDLEVSGGI